MTSADFIKKRRNTESEDKIKLLSAYFSKRDDILMAFVFGSYANKTAHQESDWDIAIYFKPVERKIEWENIERQYPEEDHLWRDCVKILNTDNVDLLILNRAPASIAETALRGVVLIVKDWSLWLKFTRVITAEAEDYRRFVDEMYAISQRSRSLAERDAEDLKRTIRFLEEQMSLYAVYKGFQKEEYNQEPRKRNEIERWLENIVNAVIDISKVVLGSRKRLIPSTYREAVEQSAREFHLSEATIEKLEHWIRLRNELAHEYLDIKWKKISDFAKTSEPHLKQFIEAAKGIFDKDA